MKEYQKLNIKLLYVEDEDLLRASLSRIIKRYVSSVEIAANGKEGLEKFKEFMPDIVVSDISMPQMSGLELIKEIKKINKKCTIVLTTAYNDVAHLIDAINLGIDSYLLKPIDIDRFHEIIEKAAKEILNEAELEHRQKIAQEYKKAVDATAILTISDTSGIITYANDKICEISGYTKDELIGKPHSILRHPLTSDDIFKNMWNTIKSKNIWSGTLRNKKKNGDSYFVNTTIVPVIDENDEIVEYLGIRYDITTIIENEQNLKIAMEKAKNADKAKSDFLANMSHEIRTPMNGIIGFLDVLNDTSLSDAQKNYLNLIKTSADHLMGVINDILDFSKIESGKLVLEFITFDIKKELKNSTFLFNASASEKDILLSLDIDESIPDHLVGDPLRLRQVISNLTSNALKFTPAGGKVIISIKNIGNDDSSVKLLFEVIDSGIGIPPNKLRAIFNPFEQADNSVTRKFGGTGLGLSICSKLVEKMGGFLDVASEVGHGAKFFFELSFVVDNEYKKDESAESIKDDILYDARVLVAEDNQINQKLISILLNAFGLKIDLASNGKIAIELFLTKRYDLIFMDINMPELDGREATKEIRRAEVEKNLERTPIVALTANALKGDKERFLTDGMDEYLTKPINKNELKSMLYTFLKNKLKDKDNNKDNNNINSDNNILGVQMIDKDSYVADLCESLGIDKDTVQMLVDEFFEIIEEDMDGLSKAIANKDKNEIYARAHSIKGSSGNLRLQSIYEKSSFIQDSAAQNQEIDYQSCYAELKEIVKQTKRGFEC